MANELPHRDPDSRAVGSDGPPSPRSGNREATFRSRLAAELRTRIDNALGETASQPGTTAALIEARVKGVGARAWAVLKRHPSVGIIGAGGAGLLAAEIVGVAELGAALACAYAAYDVLKKGVPLNQALERTSRLFRS